LLDEKGRRFFDADMRKKFLIGLLVVILGSVAIALVLANEKSLVTHPMGLIAEKQLELIVLNILLMLVIIVPTYLVLFFVVWKYCLVKKTGEYDPEHSYGAWGVLFMWLLPSLVVAVMGVVTWNATHALNPYKPIDSPIKPLTVEVVAIDWKWLFIYPEQGIASLNHLHIPEQTPIHLKLTADNAPMSSFWIPQLSGQIYSMTGMTTQLNLIANGPGNYVGKAVEINGEGYSGMTFSVTSTSEKEFQEWVMGVKKSPERLTKERYNELAQTSIIQTIIPFSDVERDLFRQIVEKYMYPTGPLLWKTSSSAN